MVMAQSANFVIKFADPWHDTGYTIGIRSRLLIFNVPNPKTLPNDILIVETLNWFKKIQTIISVSSIFYHVILCESKTRVGSTYDLHPQSCFVWGRGVRKYFYCVRKFFLLG